MAGKMSEYSQISTIQDATEIEVRDVAEAAGSALQNKTMTALQYLNYVLAKNEFDTEVQKSRLDQMALPTSSVNMNGQKVIGAGDPANAQDLVTKNYFDANLPGAGLWENLYDFSTTDQVHALSIENPKRLLRIHADFIWDGIGVNKIRPDFWFNNDTSNVYTWSYINTHGQDIDVGNDTEIQLGTSLEEGFFIDAWVHDIAGHYKSMFVIWTIKDDNHMYFGGGTYKNTADRISTLNIEVRSGDLESGHIIVDGRN